MNKQLFEGLELSMKKHLSEMFLNDDLLINQLLEKGKNSLKDSLIEEVKLNGTKNLQDLLTDKITFMESNLNPKLNLKLNEAWSGLINDNNQRSEICKTSLNQSIDYIKSEYKNSGYGESIENIANFLGIDINIIKFANSKVGKWVGKWF